MSEPRRPYRIKPIVTIDGLHVYAVSRKRCVKSFLDIITVSSCITRPNYRNRSQRTSMIALTTLREASRESSAPEIGRTQRYFWWCPQKPFSPYSDGTDQVCTSLSSVILTIILWCVQLTYDCSSQGLLGLAIWKSKWRNNYAIRFSWLEHYTFLEWQPGQ